MIIVLYFFLTCAFIFVSMYYLSLRLKDRSKYLRNVPGPTPTFPFGNMLDFFSGSAVYLDKLTEYFKTYGDTCLIHDGAFSWVVVSIDYEFVEAMFNSSVNIDKSSQYHFMKGWLGDGLLTSTGSKWRSKRKMITPAFHFSKLQEFVGNFENTSDNLLKRLEKEVDKENVLISKIASLYALDIICEAAMGVKINALEQGDSPYVKNIKSICSVIVDRAFSFNSSIIYPLTWTYYKEKVALKGIHNHVDDVINKRIQERTKKISHDREKTVDDCGVKKRLAFLDLLLETTVDGRPLTKKELRDEVNTFMIGGHDSSSSAMSFCLLMLANNPKVQEKVYKEQCDLFQRDLTTFKPTYRELHDMKYLEMVLKETLRLFPSIPLIGRQIVKEFECKGIMYPVGLNVIMCPFAAHRNPKYFPDPEKFIPERFLDQTEYPAFAYTPFSAGPRNCIGQKFAMLEMLYTISKVIRNYEVAPATPEHNIQLVPETVLISKNGVRIAIRNRT